MLSLFEMTLGTESCENLRTKTRESNFPMHKYTVSM